MKLTALHARASRGWIALAGLVGALLITMSAAHAAPEAPGRVGRVAQTDGTVWIWDAEGGEWTAAVPNRPLLAGDRLAVDDDGRAELRIGPTVLRLDGGTELAFGALDDHRLEFELHRGSLALRVPSDEHARETAVVTEEGRFEPIAAGHYRFDRQTPGRIDQPDGAPVNGGIGFLAVARQPRHIIDQRQPLARKAIEQGGLADIRPSGDDN
jgi:hypothetical protein